VRITLLLAFAVPALLCVALPQHAGVVCALKTRMKTNLPSLYERLGGEDMIAALIPAFYVRVLADPELGPFFKHTELPKLHAMQHEFFVMATGGPIQYSGRPLAHTHHGRGITKHHFARFTGHLVETLLDMGVTREEADEVIQRINAMTNEIVGTSY
jgi:hemoglobin